MSPDKKAILALTADNERLRGALQEICAVDKAAPGRKDCQIWADMLAIASYALTGRDSFMSLDELTGAAVQPSAVHEKIAVVDATHQPNGATGWIDNAVTPPGESVERVLVAYPTGLVETTQAHYVRLYPTNYPWWMPLPVAPDPTPQPQPSAFNKTTALILLSAASKSGDEGAMRLAAELANAAPCAECGYVHFRCKCEVTPSPTPQPQPDAVASTFADCETAMGMEYTTPPCACAEYYPGLPHHPDCPTRNADPTPAALSPAQLEAANLCLASESARLQEALRFYDEQEHIVFTDKAEEGRWESGSDPEAPNWMSRLDLSMMIEDGGVAREALKPFEVTADPTSAAPAKRDWLCSQPGCGKLHSEHEAERDRDGEV